MVVDLRITEQFSQAHDFSNSNIEEDSQDAQRGNRSPNLLVGVSDYASPSGSSYNTVCRYCGKNFLFESRLRRHMYVHTGERPFTCEYCGKSFNQKASLGQHVLIHSDRKPFMCNICGKQFIKKSIFLAHSQVHTNA